MHEIETFLSVSGGGDVHQGFHPWIRQWFANIINRIGAVLNSDLLLCLIPFLCATDSNDHYMVMLKRYTVEKYMDLFLSLPSTIDKSVILNALIW